MSLKHLFHTLKLVIWYQNNLICDNLNQPVFPLVLESHGSSVVAPYPSPTTLCKRVHKVIFRCYYCVVCFTSRQKKRKTVSILSIYSYNTQEVWVLNLSSPESKHSGPKRIATHDSGCFTVLTTEEMQENWLPLLKIIFWR